MTTYCDLNSLLREKTIDDALSLAEKNGKQEGNKNATHHLDVYNLNNYDDFWSTPIKGAKLNKTTFHTESVVMGVDGTEKMNVRVDFTPRGKRPFDYIVKTLEAMNGGSGKPLMCLFGLTDRYIINAIDIILTDIIETLDSGKRYSIPNASSIKVPTQWKIRIALFQVQYRYFMGLDQDPLPEKEIVSSLSEKEESEFKDLEDRLQEIRQKTACFNPHILPRTDGRAKNPLCVNKEEIELNDRLNRLIAKN
jgi:hypothetical protein